MKNFQLYSNCVIVNFWNGTSKTIYFDDRFTGKAYYRFKTNTVSGIKHPCIYLGSEANGTQYCMHNHEDNGLAIIDTWEGFLKGKEVYFYRPSKNNQIVVLQRALEMVKSRKPYNLLKYNCQTFVNLACNNEWKSESVEEWNKGLKIGLGVFSVIAIIAGITARND